MNPLILAEHDSPPLNQTTWDTAPGHLPSPSHQLRLPTTQHCHTRQQRMVTIGHRLRSRPVSSYTYPKHS